MCAAHTSPEHLARGILAGAARVVVLTGAGISAESGVPTFRGADGLWKSHRPESLATPEAFARDPRLVWEWYGWRRTLVAACRPNAAHLALAEAARTHEAFRIVTQNVDGLHAEAARAVGGTGAAPLELHGSLFRARCTGCGLEREHRDPVDATSEETLPRCDRCGALLRPAVVWFGESLDPAVLDEAWSLARGADACLVIGTSGVVQPAASLADVTRAAGGAVIEVNPEETALSGCATVVVRGRAVEKVPGLVTGSR